MLCAQHYTLDLDKAAALATRWHGIAAREGVRLELETHRNTMTNDLRFTAALAQRLPEDLELAIDLSHYVVGAEIPSTPTAEIEGHVAALLQRAGSTQGRVASRCQVQLPLHHPASQPWIELAQRWWKDAFVQILRRRALSGSNRDVVFLTELGTAPYAITDAEGVQVSDRWAEAALLREWAPRPSPKPPPKPRPSDQRAHQRPQVLGVPEMTAEPTYSTTKTGNTIVDGPLSEETYGQSILPAAAYTDPAEFAREQKLIFSAEWVWAGYAHWIANEGDVHPVEVAGKPLLMVRDGEGSVNVFHNSCRHRGMVVTQEPIEVTQRIQCAYHCWSYNLDGSLAAAPYFNRERRGAPSPEARQKLGLLPVPSAVWAGMIFVNLSPDPTPFEDVIGPLAERWSHIDFSRLHLAEERVFDLEVNWKLAVENFLDFYHLPLCTPRSARSPPRWTWTTW